MTDAAFTSETGPAPSINTVPPPIILPGVAASRVIIDAIQPTIKEIRDEIKKVEDKADTHFKYLIGAFAAGFVLLAGAFAAGFLYLDSKIDDTSEQLGTSIDSNYKALDDKFELTQELLVKINTQIGFLIPTQTPVQTPSLPQISH